MTQTEKHPLHLLLIEGCSSPPDGCHFCHWNKHVSNHSSSHIPSGEHRSLIFLWFLVLKEKCSALHPSHALPTSSLLLMRVTELIHLLLVEMGATLQQHISHATGWSGMWMTACWEVNLYSCCCDAHARVCFKKKGGGGAIWTGSFNSSDRNTMN